RSCVASCATPPEPRPRAGAVVIPLPVPGRARGCLRFAPNNGKRPLLPGIACDPVDFGLNMPRRAHFPSTFSAVSLRDRPDGFDYRGNSMSVVQQLHCAPRYNTLRLVEDAERGVYRCNMHADLAAAPGRACFKTALINEILHYQQALADRLRFEPHDG